jgi:DNA-binding transcriptional ArsR family regulator
MNHLGFEIQTEFYKAMGSAVRLQLLHVLRAGPKTVGEIRRETGLSQSNVSRQLACLRSAEVVASKRVGNEMVYQITDERVDEVCDLVQSILAEQIQKHSRLIGLLR